LLRSRPAIHISRPLLINRRGNSHFRSAFSNADQEITVRFCLLKSELKIQDFRPAFPEAGRTFTVSGPLFEKRQRHSHFRSTFWKAGLLFGKRSYDPDFRLTQVISGFKSGGWGTVSAFYPEI
jgi:hypothetical protein